MEKIIAKQIGRNIITVIDGKKYSKKTIDNDEVKSIANKIELYNKKPSKERKNEIINIFDTIKVEKEKKEVKIKGLKSSIKKEVKKTSKKSSKKEDVKEVNLIDEVRKAHAEGEVTDADIKSLQDLLKKAEEKKASQEAPKQSEPRRGEY